MCGIFSAFNVDGAARVMRDGLHDQQHRAQEFAGGVSVDDSGVFHFVGGEGIAIEVFTEKRLEKLPGKKALGHIRYSTVQDDPALGQIQPIIGIYNGQERVALAHNGNLTNVAVLRNDLFSRGVPLVTSIDTECVLRQFCSQRVSNRIISIRAALENVCGSYSLVFLFADEMIGVRDLGGNRPLFLGKLGEGILFSSEDCSLKEVGATVLREVNPGEIVSVSESSLRSANLFPEREICPAHCVFELCYFASERSRMFGHNVSGFRFRLGRALEEEAPAPTEIVMPVPDSAIFQALGFADSGRSGKFGYGLSRSHYSGRSFTKKEPIARQEAVRRKFRTIPHFVQGKRLALVDDSIVRLNTMPYLVSRLKAAGAREIHVRIGCPPIIKPCRYGIDMQTEDELAASRMNVDQMQSAIGCDSLSFLSLPALKKVVGKDDDFCFACMTGGYPAVLG